MRRLVLPLALLLLWTGEGTAESVYPGEVRDAALALGPAGTPVVAYVADGVLSLATRQAAGWAARPLFVLPSRDSEIDGLVVARDGRVSVLVRDADARWLALVRATSTGSWRWTLIRPRATRNLIGPSGLTLDADQRPVVAYAVWHQSEQTSLRLVRADARGRLRTSGVTKKGFPPSPTLAAAAPVLMPSGQIRVVETFAPAAIEWRPIPGDWVGQFLHSSALGVPTGRIAATAPRSTLYAAWTEAYPTLGPPAVVLAVRGSSTGSSVAVENAVLAGLVLTSAGPEIAANRCVVEESCFGLVGPAGVDGIIAGFAAEASGAREFLLAGESGLAWYRSSGALPIRIALNRDLSGRVAGASSGLVTLYREVADGTRAVVGTFPIAADGTFAASDPTAGPAAAAHRVVYVDPATSIPYASVIGPAG